MREAKTWAIAVSCSFLACSGGTCSKAKEQLTDDKPTVVGIAPLGTAPPAPANSPPEWLKTDGNKFLNSDGTPFHGRGVNLHDTRSCNACTFEDADPNEVIRRADIAIDGWHSNFIRYDLESYDKAEARTHYKPFLDDPDYVKDLQKIVDHMVKKKGVYVMLTIWKDPSLSAMGWPTADTVKEWEKLASIYKDEPHVLFSVSTEPERNEKGLMDDKVWKSMNDVVTAIRKVEGDGPHHIVVVQGTREFSRVLDYYVSHPIAAGGGANIVYETHVYDPAEKFQARFIDPKKKLPVIIGEFGPEQDLAKMTLDDCKKLMEQAEANDVPYLAWTFHFRCPPNLIEDHSAHSCGQNMDFIPTEWGKAFKSRLEKPW